jgi:pSer/pThr/pTyr-binding forkhead associated (FHA) protein
VISCPKCGKENQEHYKFCLGCGAELSRADAMRLSGANHVLPAPVAVQVAPAPVPVSPVALSPSAAPAVKAGACPQCAHVNGPTNMFCGSCGFRLAGISALPPVAHIPHSSSMPARGELPTVVLTALRADGSEAGTHTLPVGGALIGRETGGIFAADSYLSPRHALFRIAASRMTVKDEASLNGVYRKLQRDAPVELAPGDVFRIGQEIVKYEALDAPVPSPDGVERLGAPAKGYVGRLALVVGRETTGNAFPIPETGIHLGRERGDVLFPEDGYVSGLHCRLANEGGKMLLTDLGSSNGTFVRIKEETAIVNGDVLLMGQQLFRVNIVP